MFCTLFLVQVFSKEKRWMDLSEKDIAEPPFFNVIKNHISCGILSFAGPD